MYNIHILPDARHYLDGCPLILERYSVHICILPVTRHFLAGRTLIIKMYKINTYIYYQLPAIFWLDGHL